MAGIAAVTLTVTRAPGPVFDDCSEFAYCAQEWGVPHPPGFPAWVTLAHGWLALPFLSGNVFQRLGLFSVLASSLALVLATQAHREALRRLRPSWPGFRRDAGAALAGLGCGFGMTFWQWGNAVEVYALQWTAVAAVYLAAVRQSAGRFPLLGLAAGLGLANHHLSMGVVLMGALWMRALLFGPKSLLRGWRRELATAAAVLVGAYGILVWRAGSDFPFEFGDPSTPSRLWHHLTGGFYRSSLFEGTEHLSVRVAFFARLIGRHFLFLLVPLAVGLLQLGRWRPLLPLACSLALLALFGYQSASDQVANADTYLVPGLILLGLPTALGLGHLAEKPLAWLAAVLAVLPSAWLNAPLCDRSDYDAGRAYLADFDASAPPRALVLLTEWDLKMLYDEARFHGGFRTDLVVLHSDVKGTNHRAFEVAYPGVHGAIRGPYTAYLDAIRRLNPDYVRTDFFAIRNRDMAERYRDMLDALFRWAQSEGRPVLMDRGTVRFLTENGYVAPGILHPCGLLFSIGELQEAPPVQATGAYWNQPFLLRDLCAATALQNYYETSREQARYFEFRGLERKRQAAEAVHRRIAQVVERYARTTPVDIRKSP